jgi:hypothetical protein
VVSDSQRLKGRLPAGELEHRRTGHGNHFPISGEADGRLFVDAPACSAPPPRGQR